MPENKRKTKDDIDSGMCVAIINCRYGGGFLAVTGYNASDAADIVDYMTDSGDAFEYVEGFLRTVSYPHAFANSAIEAVKGLYNSTYEGQAYWAWSEFNMKGEAWKAWQEANLGNNSKIGFWNSKELRDVLAAEGYDVSKLHQ